MHGRKRRGQRLVERADVQQRSLEGARLEQPPRPLGRHGIADLQQRVPRMIQRAVAGLPARVRLAGPGQALERVEPGDAALDPLGIEGMRLRQQRQADAGEHAELDDVALDGFVVDVLNRTAERRPAGVAPDHLRHDIARLVAGRAPGAPDGAVHERHDSIPAGDSTRGVTDHAHSTCT